MEYWAIISLIGLVVVVVISNVKNINVGLVGFAMAMLLGTLSGLPIKEVYGSFNTKIFLQMLGMQVLIVVARNNGTMNILANAVMKLTKEKLIRLLPIVLYFLMGIASWFNLGISMVLTPMVFALSAEMGFKSHLTLGFSTMFMLMNWGISPYSMQGLNLATYAAEQGYTLNLWAGAFTMAIIGSIMFFAMYFILGWHKMQPIALVANKTVAPAVMNFLCAFMSIFSSGNGVVIPTMSASVSSLCQTIPGLNPQTMFWAVAMGANATPMSPMSTVGANSLAYYSATSNPSEAEFKKAFNRQLLVAGVAMIWSTIAGLCGMFAMFK